MSYDCPKCSASFSTRDALRKHIYNEHIASDARYAASLADIETMEAEDMVATMDDIEDSLAIKHDELDEDALGDLQQSQTEKQICAHVRCLCKNGDVNRAIIGYGRNCKEAWAHADTKVAFWCTNRGGLQKRTRVKCPYP